MNKMRGFKSLAVGCFVVLCASSFADAPEAYGVVKTLEFEFVASESTFTWYVGRTGHQVPHSIEGTFELEVDYDAGTVCFSSINAFLSDAKPAANLPTVHLNGQALDAYTRFSELSGVIDGDRFVFHGRFQWAGTIDSVISTSLTITDETGIMTGHNELSKAIPDADGYGWDAQIAVVPEPATVLLLGLGFLLARRACCGERAV